jgi:D-serine deaminase-like pyridoxal phosphate-dependent protein
MTESATARYQRYRRAIAEARMPCAIVDLDAVDANAATLLGDVRPSGKTLRLATKSVRCPALIEHLQARDPELMRGLMGFSAREAEFLVERGQRDILIAYPSVQPADIDLLCQLNRDDATVSIIVDSIEHIERLSTGARSRDGEIPVVIEVDMSLRALGGRVHLGVKRSPAHTAEDVLAIARAARDHDGVRFHGVMGYEAQVAGLGDDSPFSRALNPVKRAIRRASIPVVSQRRKAVADLLTSDGFTIELFNGGGTGSLNTTSEERAVTEVTAGSGFLCSHLFDYYRHLSLEPAAYFALQVVRRPDPDYVTCHGGGLVASGEAGRDRLPIPALPEGLALTNLEGAGEVQTPLHGDAVVGLDLGDPVFFRHAKAGELAEHFDEYLLVRGDRVVERVPTYRALGVGI